MKPRLILALAALLLVASGRVACAQGTGPVLQQYANPTAPDSNDTPQSILGKLLLAMGRGTTLASVPATSYRNQAVSSAPVLIKSTAGNVLGWNVINPNSTPVYVKLYDSAAPVVGTTVPALVYAVPANGGFVITRNGFPHGVCATAVSVACVTGYLDNSTTAPTTGVFVQISVSN